MSRIVITSAARTPVGAFLGGLKTVPVQELAARAIEEAIKRSKIDQELVDEVILGHVISSADAGNLGRLAALKAGLRYESTGMTVNRICGSGIQAVVSATQELLFMKDKEIIVAGGAECLSRIPYYLPLSARYEGFRMGHGLLIDSDKQHHENSQPHDLFPDIHHMGDTAENVVAKYELTREEQDEFAYHSQMKAKKAMESGRLAEEIFPVEIKGKKGAVTIVDTDEHPRPDTTLEALAKLKPAFKMYGSVTPGNSSGVNDGAAAMVLMKEEKAEELGLRPMAYVVDYSIVGVDPALMGLGPVPAIQKLLAQNNLTLEDIDLLEINEAFAGQTLGCLKELGNYPGTPLYERLNVNGGAVALGHPLGMSGARIITTLCYEFKHRPKARYAIASACIGGGQGIAILLENYQS
ncbi:thiolase family protein [Bacillus sp. JJ1764]|uniref:thiolase family protein n=1 Tax=Bacillus sp. JJ1764 TaxID=3122964 RepID=UPI002FFD9B8C